MSLRRLLSALICSIVLTLSLTTCVQTVPEPVKVASISLDKGTINLKVGETVTLKATVSPNDAADKTVKWSSSDASVATVSNGVVTAVKVGTATITAIAGDKTATCSVTVEEAQVTSITLDKTSVSLKVGETVSLTAKVSPDNATDKTVIWSTSDAEIATVKEGLVTAVKIGSATITAKAGDKTATCKVTVEATPVTSITLDRTSASLKAGESVTLTARVSPDDATDKTVTWSTSDASVATVQDGVVTAHKVGSATITAKAGDKTATCTVTVEATPVESISIDKASVTLKVGETVTLTATVSPDNATDKTVTWSTPDASIATVQDGVVTARKVGTVIITAISGGKTATCMVIVEAPPFTSISLDKTSASLKAGESVTLTARVSPDDATDKTVTWSTSDASVATVQDGVVTAHKVGSATITAKAGDKTATCAVTVEATPVESISIDKASVTLKVGETVTLTATVSPDNATDKTVTWSTPDASIATVQDGVVTALGSGSAYISAKAGEKSASCLISVTVPVSSVALNQNEVSMTVGNTVELIATVYPTNATNQEVVWSSSDRSIVTVDKGLITAKQVGNCTVSVTTVDGEFNASCRIRVKGDGLDPGVGDWESGGNHGGDAD